MAVRPKVSVIIATHNNAEHIGECMDSIFSQTMDEYEVIAVDVNCTDGTKDWLEETDQEDENVTYLAENWDSLGYAKNVGLNRARAPYVIFVDPEDYLHRDALEYMCYWMDNQPDCDVFACETDTFGDNSYGRTYEDRKRIHEEANKTDPRRREMESRLMRDLMFNHISMYRKDFLLDNDIMHYEVPGSGSQDIAFRFLALAKGNFSFSVGVLYECRKDIIDPITDQRMALEICREFQFLKEKLMEEPQLWQKFRLVFWQSYYDRNMAYYEMLSDDIRPTLSKRMQADIKDAIHHKEYSSDYFDVAVRDEMELLMKSAGEFDSYQTRKLRRREQERDKEIVKADRMARIIADQEENEIDRISRESAVHAEEIRQKNRLNRKWLMEEMGRDLAPLRMLIGLTSDEMSVMLGVSGSTYKSLESGKKGISWDQYLALLFFFHYNDRTSGVIDTLGLYPELLKIRLEKGYTQVYA